MGYYVPATYGNPATMPQDDADPLIDALIAEIPTFCSKCESDMTDTLKRGEVWVDIQHHWFPYRVCVLECERQGWHECDCEFCTEDPTCDNELCWVVISPAGQIEAIGSGRPDMVKLFSTGRILPKESYPMLALATDGLPSKI